ncbi:MAG TPA: regulatory protein RecX [Spirochaetia bacterium]
MQPLIVSMQLKGAGGEKVLIHLSDGSSFVLHAEASARAGLCEGVPVDSELRDRLLGESEHLFARSTALRLIARAPQTRRGLARKLSTRGFGGEAVRTAVARMEELGYLDDRVFAEAWLRSRLGGRPEGWKSLYRGLIGRGVPRPVAEEALGALFGPEEELAAARRLSRGLSPATAARKLQARGFRTRAIAVVVRDQRGTGREHPTV